MQTRFSAAVPGTLRPDFLPILRTLSEHRVDFILVGGVAAVVQGAPIMTFDVDVLYSTEADNLVRLLAAVDALDGFYRLQPERRLEPQISHLAAAGHQLLMTRFGPLDLLGHVGSARTYQGMLPHTAQINVGEGA